MSNGSLQKRLFFRNCSTIISQISYLETVNNTHVEQHFETASLILKKTRRKLFI